MKKLFLIALLAILSFQFTSFISAHPGNTDAYGCHTCRTNCSKRGLSNGEYHCHNSKGLTQPLPQVTSSNKTNTTTYVTPVYTYVKVPTVAELTEAKTIIVSNTSTNSVQYVSVDKLVLLLDDPEVSKAVKEYQAALVKMNKILKEKLTEIEKQL